MAVSLFTKFLKKRQKKYHTLIHGIEKRKVSKCGPYYFTHTILTCDRLKKTMATHLREQIT